MNTETEKSWVFSRIMSYSLCAGVAAGMVAQNPVQGMAMCLTAGLVYGKALEMIADHQRKQVIKSFEFHLENMKQQEFPPTPPE